MGKHLAPKSKHELKKQKRRRDEDELDFFDADDAAAEDSPAPFRGGVLSYLIPAFSALLLLIVHFLPLEGWMVPAAYAVPLLFAAPELCLDAYERVREGRYFSNETLTLAACVLLFASACYSEAILLLLLFRIGRLLEKRLAERCENSLAAVSDMLPESASLVSGEELLRVRPDEVRPGDVIRIEPGETIPLDGVIIEGITTVDTAAISGQRSPWAVNEGYRVYSGCKNLTSEIRLRVTRPFEQSTVRKLVRLAEEAQSFPTEQELLARRINKYAAPVLAGAALLVAVLVPVFRGAWLEHLRRAAMLLIAARSAAELSAIPIAYKKGLGLLFHIGVFAKGEDCLEALALTETMVFDKTGTITEGRYSVTDVFPVKMSEHELLTIAATAEGKSRSPLANALREAAGKIDSRVIAAVKAEEIPGRGISAAVGGRLILVGNAALLEEHGVRCAVPTRSGSAVHVAVDSRYCGHILVSDKVRRRAFDALEGLRVEGIEKLVLLTGDVLSVARPLASKLNFDMLRAELRPADKAAAVEYLRENKGENAAVAFVGSGEQSGRIMAQADIGIAMGALGSDAALAAADVLIMDRDILKLPRTVSLSKRIYRVARENLFGGGAMQLLIAVLGLLGILSPLAAALISFAAWAAVLLNTLRIR